MDPAEAGAKLKADYVMTGLVRQNAGGWILSADLTRAADAASLWGENWPPKHPNLPGTARCRSGAARAPGTRYCTGCRLTAPPHQLTIDLVAETRDALERKPPRGKSLVHGTHECENDQDAFLYGHPISDGRTNRRADYLVT